MLWPTERGTAAERAGSTVDAGDVDGPDGVDPAEIYAADSRPLRSVSRPGWTG
jgi:hypothetical protein